MAAPKPITVEYIDPAEYDGPEPQPFAIVGEAAEIEAGPITVADVTGLQAIIADLTDRIEALEAAAA